MMSSKFVRPAALACVVLCFACPAYATVPISNPTKLSSLPTALGVTVGYLINGQQIAGNPSCTAGVYNSACLPQLNADDPNNKLLISYQVLPNATLPSTAHVSLKVCYSAPSAKDRLWRKANDIIVLDKLCSFTVKMGLPLTAGTVPVQWTPSELVPNAVYFVRAFAVCPNSTYGTSQCGVGNSKGFFQINQINSRPGNLKGAVIGMCFAGPVIFFLYFGIDSALTKRKDKKTQGTGQSHIAPGQMDEKVSTLT